MRLPNASDPSASSMPDTIHRAVLVEESMLVLDVKPGGRYLDGTLGGGTHSEELLRRSSPDGRVLSLDVDPKALARARERLAPYGDRWTGAEENFRHLDRAAVEQGMAPLDGILLDLGLSPMSWPIRPKACPSWPTVRSTCGLAPRPTKTT